jgi:hypothetical protein
MRHDGRRPVCERCASNEPPFDPKPDIKEWVLHKLTDPSWEQWRVDNPDWAEKHLRMMNRSA